MQYFIPIYSEVILFFIVVCGAVDTIGFVKFKDNSLWFSSIWSIYLMTGMFPFNSWEIQMDTDLPFSGGVSQGYLTNQEAPPRPLHTLTHVHFILQKALPFFLKSHKIYHISKFVPLFLFFPFFTFGWKVCFPGLVFFGQETFCELFCLGRIKGQMLVY